MIELLLTGIGSYKRLLGNSKKVVNSSELMKEAAENAKQYAEENCPEDTGELLKSIYVEVKKDGFFLGAFAPHAVFNEYGCYNLPCGTIESPVPAKYIGFRPFLRPAIYRVRDEFPSIYGKKMATISAQGGRLD